jgi:hypothetical protein
MENNVDFALFSTIFCVKRPKFARLKVNPQFGSYKYLKLFNIKIWPFWHDACKLNSGPLGLYSPKWIKNEFFQ